MQIQLRYCKTFIGVIFLNRTLGKCAKLDFLKENY